MTDPLWKWDAADLAAAIRKRDISAYDAVAACVARMHDVNPRLNAVTVDLSEQALAKAKHADEAIARGDAIGPLHGVPVTTKENVDQEGCATVNGVAAYRDVIAGTDSPVVANLKKAGAIIIGRTNTPAMSFRLDTVNDFRGRTYSPWSRGHTPGGSSGGASSSVAAGITPIGQGNDIAGSVRYPAFCTGLVGLRPSFGRIPAYNGTATRERTISSQLMSVQGPLARSVRDVRLALQAMAQHDPRDPWWIPAPLIGPDAPRRVAIVDRAADLGGIAPNAAMQEALRTAASALTDAGYEVVREQTPGFARAFELWFEMLIPEFRKFMHADFERDGDDGVRTAMRYVLDNVPEKDEASHLRALSERTRRHPRLERLPCAHAARPDGRVHRASVRARFRPRKRRAHDAPVARGVDADGAPRAGIAGHRRSDRARRRPSDRRADRRSAIPRGSRARRRGGDRGARAKARPHRSAIISRTTLSEEVLP